MLIHSIVPPELLEEATPLPQRQLLPFYDGFVEVEGSGTNCTVSRVISTNPAVYLDKRFAPGAQFSINNPRNKEI